MEFYTKMALISQRIFKIQKKFFSKKKADLILQDGYSNQATLLSEPHSVSSQTYEIELFASMVNS